MATASDFDAYDISATLKTKLAEMITNLENRNERLFNQYQDLKKEIDALRDQGGALIQTRRDIKAEYDANLATIQELKDALPPLPSP